MHTSAFFAELTPKFGFSLMVRHTKIDVVVTDLRSGTDLGLDDLHRTFGTDGSSFRLFAAADPRVLRIGLAREAAWLLEHCSALLADPGAIVPIALAHRVDAARNMVADGRFRNRERHVSSAIERGAWRDVIETYESVPESELRPVEHIRLLAARRRA